ncbi:hypothetical protein Tco_0737842 [Tanacetum coccineum]
MVSAIASVSSSSEYSWSESKLKSGDLNSSRLSVLKCLLDDRNSHLCSLKLDTPYPMEVDTPYSVIDQNNGLEVGSIRQIQGLDTTYWGFLRVGTMLDIFQNIIFIPYFEYDVDVLRKSFEELKEVRARDKELFEEAKEDNRKQYKEKLMSHALTMKGEMVKEVNAKMAEMFSQYTQTLPIPLPSCCVLGPEIIAHSSDMILLLRSVTVLPVTGNFNISWAVDGIALILLTFGLHIIPLYEECDLTTMKFIHAEVECFSSPIFTSSDTCHSGHIISPLNPTKYVVAGTIWFLISGWSWLKQCSYRIFEEAPPSTYMQWTRCPPTLASITIGPSVPSSSPKGGNEIIVSGENV